MELKVLWRTLADLYSLYKSESKKFELWFKWLTLFNDTANVSNIENRFIQKDAVCVYRIIQTV